jgi:hypothetical protein
VYLLLFNEGYKWRTKWKRVKRNIEMSLSISNFDEELRRAGVQQTMKSVFGEVSKFDIDWMAIE